MLMALQFPIHQTLGVIPNFAATQRTILTEMTILQSNPAR